MDTLLERGAELAAIRSLLDSGGGALLIEGRLGIGKTALLKSATQHAAAQGWDVLSARGSQLEADFAFGVVYQLFERRLAGLSVEERATLLPVRRVRRARCFRKHRRNEALQTQRSPSSTAGTGWLPMSRLTGRY